MVTRVIDLVDFAEREQFAKMTEGVDDADVACRNGLLHGARHKIVSDEDGNMVVPNRIDSRAVATSL